MSFFHYEALAQAGLYQQMIDDMRRQYGQMVDYGATTCWEMYPKMKDGRINPHNLTRSHCHAWSAAPGYFLGAFVLGVRPASAGWRKVTVEPRVCGLAWARGSVPLPDEGRIDVAWTLDSGRLKLTIWAPANVEVDARLPEGTDGEIELIRLGE
jgi:hypothetical protein